MSGLERLLRPRSIAVVGGGAWCANVIEQCQRSGFDGPVWPVHPTRAEVGGVPAFASVEALPEAPDATFIGVNRAATIEVVRSLSRAGAGGAICFASGFSEAQQETGDGTQMQADLLAAAGEMKIIGPNCYGLLNYLDGAVLWPDQHGGVPVERGVAIITQSSNIAINLTMQARGVPLAYVLTAGNQAQTDLAELGVTALEDPRVTALGLHIEGISDLRAFEALALRARALGKRVVALKVGASDQAQAATISHTASLAGSDAGADALLRRLGIGRVRSLPALLEVLKLLHVVGPLSSARIASMSCSGGEASLMADSALGTGLEFPPLDAAQAAALRAALGPKVALANPLDYHTYIWGDQAAMANMMTAMMQGDLALGIAVLDFPRQDRCSIADWAHVIEAAETAVQSCGKPLAMLTTLPENMPEDVAGLLISKGVVPLFGVAEALEAVAVAVDLGAPWEPPAAVQLPRAPAAARVLSEAEAKAALAPFGVPVPQSARAAGVDDLARVSDGLSYPLVLKGEGVAHKTESGAVALNLSSAEALTEAATRMSCDSFLVEEMIIGSDVEMLVGVVQDPAHGYVLTLAAGGVLTELLEDSVSLLLPTTGAAIDAALVRLRINRLLTGYRGAPAVDRKAVIRAIQAIEGYVMAHHPLEVEVNPLMCGESFAIAADALIKIGETND